MTLPAASQHRLPDELAGMPLALTLVESSSTVALRKQAAQLLQEHLGLVMAECLYVEGSGRWLGRDSDDLQFDCADFNHPYAHAIRSGKPLTLSVADARIRLDHSGFQSQLAALNGALQLHILPLRAVDGPREWLGALLLVGQSTTLAALANAPGMVAFEALLCRLWSRLAREQGERQRSQVLKDSLAKLNDGARRQNVSGSVSGGSARPVVGHANTAAACHPRGGNQFSRAAAR